MKKKNRKYLIISIVLILLIVASIVTYIILTRKPEPVKLSIHKYYDKDRNEIKVGKQQLTISGISGVRYIDFKLEVYNADTVDLDFEIISTNPPELAFEYEVSPHFQSQVMTLWSEDIGSWISDLVDMLPYVDTTKDFTVWVTGSSPEGVRQAETKNTTTSVIIEQDPFATFSVTISSPQIPTPPSDYCSSSDGGNTDDWIERVQFASLDVTSGGDFVDGYEDLTSYVTAVNRGENYYIQVTIGADGYTQYGKVWIDYNQDKVLEESESTELGSCLASPFCILTATINIPLDALLGNTLMRVSESYDGFPEPCELMSYGEVEDYTINVI